MVHEKFSSNGIAFRIFLNQKINPNCYGNSRIFYKRRNVCFDYHILIFRIKNPCWKRGFISRNVFRYFFVFSSRLKINDYSYKVAPNYDRSKNTFPFRHRSFFEYRYVVILILLTIYKTFRFLVRDRFQFN